MQFPFPLKIWPFQVKWRVNQRKSSTTLTPCYQLRCKGKVLSGPWLYFCSPTRNTTSNFQLVTQACILIWWWKLTQYLNNSFWKKLLSLGLAARVYWLHYRAWRWATWRNQSLCICTISSTGLLWLWLSFLLFWVRFCVWIILFYFFSPLSQ